MSPHAFLASGYVVGTPVSDHTHVSCTPIFCPSANFTTVLGHDTHTSRKYYLVVTAQGDLQAFSDMQVGVRRSGPSPGVTLSSHSTSKDLSLASHVHCLQNHASHPPAKVEHPPNSITAAGDFIVWPAPSSPPDEEEDKLDDGETEVSSARSGSPDDKPRTRAAAAPAPKSTPTPKSVLASASTSTPKSAPAPAPKTSRTRNAMHVPTPTPTPLPAAKSQIVSSRNRKFDDGWYLLSNGELYRDGAAVALVVKKQRLSTLRIVSTLEQARSSTTDWFVFHSREVFRDWAKAAVAAEEQQIDRLKVAESLDATRAWVLQQTK
ncbi:hypothetical protein B0H17DRAFT_1190486 [Mycena rosella]|uniref:Uncharacterized protein n=1 Tax=Mycena rosella TaxID=1033263 RepID=A0AAD7MD81_MYCRO|nr:hypothetical protein B0H17DRAFT_1190486 [Mycena rosella]